MCLIFPKILSYRFKQNETFVVLKFIYSGELLSLQIDLQIGSWQGISVELADNVEQKDVDP